MKDIIRLLIAEDQTIVRDGLVKLLDEIPEIVIVAEAENGRDLVEKYLKFSPDVVLSDIKMPKLNGLEALEKLKNKSENPKFVFLSIYSDNSYLYYAYKAGANGFLGKSITTSELAMAIKTAAEGGRYFLGKSESEIEEIVKNYAQKKIKIVVDVSELSEREKDVLFYIADGLASESIAQKLHISKRTVEKHRSNIMMKKDLKSYTELISYAVKFKYSHPKK